MQRRLKLVLAYSGTRYHGWQVQPGLTTVQGVVEARLATLLKTPVRVHAAGRTDAGVHARGQVVHFDTTAAIPLSGLLRGLNSLLPPDIVVRRVAEVPLDFHARYAARRKTYAYVVRNHPLRSAFTAPYAWHVPQPLDLEAMRQAALRLLGRHDFSAFRAASCSARHPVRHLMRAWIRRRGPHVLFVFTADGFLHHMVRNLVGTLVEVGLGRLPAEAVAAILQSRQRQQAGPTAPAHGLFLVHVDYGRRQRRDIIGRHH
ncbi:MAG: tRNA pseudouridine synthase A [Candidatus Tectimicrobiota bacterium]|nr:MAG: tRNA pseudouridine synthase A [Candidatus Tectomicrobia bacterium]